MGLFDNLAAAALSKLGGEQAAMAQAALEIFKQQGGLSGVLDKFNAAGLADQAASWVAKGENLPVSAEQISSVFGSDKLADMAAKLGISPDTLKNKIADFLPIAVDKMTPNGEVPAGSVNLLGTLLSMLK